MKKKLIGIIICVILIGSVLPVAGNVIVDKTPISLNSGDILYVGGNGDGNYSSIQAAIDDAMNGDTVYVYDDSSPYYENLNVDKSISLIGENRETTVLNSNGFQYFIHIKRDGVKISGFTIQNEQGGIWISDCSNHHIINNIFYINQFTSIYAPSCKSLIIKNNVFKGEDDNYDGGGISFHKTTDSIISENTFLFFRECITLSGYGNNEISYNRISDSLCGIKLNNCKDNVFLGNNLNNLTSRIYIGDDDCIDNLFYYNNFLDDKGYLRDHGKNDWDNGIEGNYWHDYEGQDLSPKDGIGDTPYKNMSGGNKDRYPLMNPWRAGNTLYVGGNGNYTKIQDAINDSIYRDTVFVYDDISPYYENIVINKSINLVGENKDTTVIDGNNIADVVLISGYRINISGFTIQNSGNEWLETPCAGIYINSSSNTICGNIISNNENGINLENSNENNTIIDNVITSNYADGLFIFQSDSNTIKDNIISNNKNGINLIGASENKIATNSISSNEKDGIVFWFIKSSEMTHCPRKNTIKDNIISNNNNGLKILGSIENKIERNHINSNEEDGIILSFIKSSEITAYSYRNTIIKNNLLDNKRNAYFQGGILMENIWKQNYWNRPRLFPKLIFGRLNIGNLPIPWFNIDWHPASEPYDIGI